jgi:hypothetical protein
MKRCRLKRSNFQIKNNMSKENETLDKPQNGNDFIADVVVSFYCNQDDGEYNNNPCAEQCNFCKEVEKTLQ